jgi:hypothetical protein
MDTIKVTSDGFDLGTWLGRNQAFTLMAGRCSAALAECLLEIKETKRYVAVEDTWEGFCANRLGISRATADRIIRQYKQLGEGYSKLNSFVKIKPAEYRLIAAAVTEEGLSYDGQTIPIEPGNTPQLARAVDALRGELIPDTSACKREPPADPAEQAFSKAGKSLETAIAEFTRLQGLNLDQEGRLRLLIAVESGRDRLDRIRLSTTL